MRRPAIFAHTALVGEALALASAEEAEGAAQSTDRLASSRQELAGARRALDRYFVAFEEGTLSPSDCQERIARLRGRMDALEAEERALEEGASEALSEPPTAEDVAEWAQELPVLLEAATPQQRKALMRLLVKELRVMSREEIRPTYKIPPVVRTPDSQVVPTGFEPVSPP